MSKPQNPSPSKKSKRCSDSLDSSEPTPALNSSQTKRLDDNLQGRPNDICIVTTDKTELYVSRALLAEHSSVLKAMMLHPFREKEENMVLLSEDSKIVQGLLSCMQKRELPLESCENKVLSQNTEEDLSPETTFLLRLLMAAEKYDIKEARTKCVTAITNRINRFNAPVVLENVQQIRKTCHEITQIMEIRQKCIDTLKTEFTCFRKSKHFPELFCQPDLQQEFLDFFEESYGFVVLVTVNWKHHFRIRCQKHDTFLIVLARLFSPKVADLPKLVEVEWVVRTKVGSGVLTERCLDETLESCGIANNCGRVLFETARYSFDVEDSVKGLRCWPPK